ncbi:hypothetical protein OTB20_25565 [Streptomyces sp. H27-H1]|uniref:hypothetical protein n=1 Tax=unclassified Streptomyces TaxID=2593676 RepID=UPI00226F26FD|nr:MULTISPECIES: hypothetical protein [unclassified Streptomyces]MCY0929508.1 hypothetical protein [Streptomyces sp. H27-H1]MCY0939661.1 hypothetical protein [Streptomyces sp. H34-S4]
MAETAEAGLPCGDTISVNAAKELIAALDSIGIALPSIRAEQSADGIPYVNLGGCASELAFELAHWIQDHQ